MSVSQEEVAAVRPKPLAVAVGYARRHLDILEGPTSGYQPRVWGYLFELAVHHPFPLTPQNLLPREASDALSDKMVLRPETVKQALEWLLRNGLLVEHWDRHLVAAADVAALRRMLHEQQDLERAGAGQSQVAALIYFRSRSMWARAAWLETVLGNEPEEFVP